MGQVKIDMPYIGGVLSVNAYKFKTKATRPEVKAWIKILSDTAAKLNVPKRKRYIIAVTGYFCDNRHPDADNLHQVIGNGLKKGIGVDDKYFLWQDKNPHLSAVIPKISIEVIWDD